MDITKEKHDLNVLNGRTNDNENQLQMENRKSLVSEQIRIIPIALPDGRHVINRSISGDSNILEKHFVQSNLDEDVEENRNDKLPAEKDIELISESCDRISSIRDEKTDNTCQSKKYIEKSMEELSEEIKSSKEHVKESKKIVEHTLSTECKMKTSFESCEMKSSTTSISDSYHLSGNSDVSVSNVSNQVFTYLKMQKAYFTTSFCLHTGSDPSINI